MKPETHSGPRRAKGLAASALLVAAVAAGVYVRSQIAVDDPAPVPIERPAPGPVGAERYDALLTEAAGGEVSGIALADRAEARVGELEAELDRTASELEPDAPWRTVFEPLLGDHPATAAEVLAAYELEIERARAFVAEQDLVTLPDAPVRVTEIRNPVFQRYFSLAMYLNGQLAVTVSPPETEEAAADGDDTSRYLRNHCRVCIPPLAVHEVFPGHHVAFEAAARAIPDEGERTAVNRRQVVFHEGWGLYAERLMLEQGYYEDPARRLGALRMLYLRALRASIDPRLHRGELSREEAERRYRDDALMTADAARSEVDRHFKDPVLKASYFLGMEQILELRSQWRAERPDALLREFHDRFLGRPRPVPEVAREAFGVTLGVP